MHTHTHSKISQKLMLSFQKDEITSAKIYDYFSKIVKDKQEQETLQTTLTHQSLLSTNAVQKQTFLKS